MHKLLSFEINPSESFTLQRESGSPCDWDACLLCQAVDISSILLCDSLVRVSASLVGRLNPYISFCHLETLHFRTLITLDPNRTYPSRPHHLSARANYHFFVPSGSCHLKYISQRLEKKLVASLTLWSMVVPPCVSSSDDLVIMTRWSAMEILICFFISHTWVYVDTN